MNIRKPSKLNKKGYTLIELLVAMTIFTIIMGSIIGIFVSVIKTQRYVLASQHLLDQSGYITERMSRAIRMAKKDLAGDCAGVGNNYSWGQVPDSNFDGLLFKNSSGICKGFFLDTTSQVLKEYDSSLSPSILPLTSSQIQVVSFGVANASNSGWSQPPDDYVQPRATIFLVMKTKGANPQPQIRFQTTISQRDLDLKEEP